MSVGEIAVRILAELRPALPGVIAAVVATLAALLILSLMSRGVWVSDRRFPLPSLFFSLEGKGVLRLACAWLKLIFLIVFLVSFQKMALIQYLMILFPGVLLAVLGGGPKQVLSGLFWFVLQMLGLTCANLVCGYIMDMSAGIGFLLIYIAISLFMILFSIYMFLLDLDSISGNRAVDASRIWRGTEYEKTE